MSTQFYTIPAPSSEARLNNYTSFLEIMHLSESHIHRKTSLVPCNYSFNSQLMHRYCAASALLRSSHLLIPDKLILCNTSFRFPTSTTRHQPVPILKSHTLLPVNQSLSICLSFHSLPVSKYHLGPWEDQKIEPAWLSGSASHDPLCPQLSPRILTN